VPARVLDISEHLGFIITAPRGAELEQRELRDLNRHHRRCVADPAEQCRPALQVPGSLRRNDVYSKVAPAIGPPVLRQHVDLTALADIKQHPYRTCLRDHVRGK
jgi:hypothetical protein